MSNVISWAESCLLFNCEGDSLPGILTRPANPSSVGLVIVVGGPQYRVGSHRQFVQLARQVAEAGHAVLRFDYRGMGDADGVPRDFQSISNDIDAAIVAFRTAVPEVSRVALWGLCDGASAALLFLEERSHAPVAGLCLLNPWVRTPHTHAAAQIKHYYARRLMDGAFWRKLFRGEVGLRRLAELANSIQTMLTRDRSPQSSGQPLPYQQRMARAWLASRCPLLLVLSGNDLTAKEFLETVNTDPAWQGTLDRVHLTQVSLPDADHTFSASVSAVAVEKATIQWLKALATHVHPGASSPASRDAD